MDNVLNPTAKTLTATPAPNERKKEDTEKKNINQCAFGKKEVNVDGSVHSINWSQAVRESIKYYNASPKATGKELLVIFSCKSVS